MKVDALVLGGLIGLICLWILVAVSRPLRFIRSAQLRFRPSTGAGLGDRTTVSILVCTVDGEIPENVFRQSHRRCEVVAAVPKSVRVAKRTGLTVVRCDADSYPELLREAASAARGEILAVLPPGHTPDPKWIQRLVGAFVNPFVAMTVCRAVPLTARGFGGPLGVVERNIRRVVNLGAHSFGAPVLPMDDAWAVRRGLLEAAGGIDIEEVEPGFVTALQLSARGFVSVYVEESFTYVNSEIPTSTGAVRRRRSAWRQLRRPLRKGKVLEGPEKTDIRWATRGAILPLAIAAAGVGVFVLRIIDASGGPEALAGFLLIIGALAPSTLDHSLGLLPAGRLRPGFLTLLVWAPVWVLSTVGRAVRR